MPRLSEMRCASCNQKLAEYEFPVGQMRVICHRPRCKTMNVVVIRDREKDELDEILKINLTQNQRNAL